MPNMYEYFVAQGLTLTRQQGFFSFIVPDRFGYNAQFVDLRKRLIGETAVNALIYKVPFPGVVADTLIFVTQKTKAPANWQIQVAEYGKVPVPRKQAEIAAHQQATFEHYENADAMKLASKIASAKGVVELGAVFATTSGFGGRSSLLTISQQDPRQIAVLKGDCIGRYHVRKHYWFHFVPKNITGRTTDPEKLGAKPRILIRKTGDRIIAAYDDSCTFVEQSLYILYNKQIHADWKYLLGLLNSELLSAYYRTKALTNKRSIAQVKKVDLDRLPLVVPDLDDRHSKDVHDRIVHLVEQIERRTSKTVRTPAEKQKLERELTGFQAQIDALVYQSYQLTDEDIQAAEKEA